MASVYELLSQYSSAKQIASVHLTKLTNLLSTASKGRYGKEKAEEIRNAAKKSICSDMPAKSLELKHTIKLIRELDAEIEYSALTERLGRFKLNTLVAVG